MPPPASCTCHVKRGLAVPYAVAVKAAEAPGAICVLVGCTASVMPCAAPGVPEPLSVDCSVAGLQAQKVTIAKAHRAAVEGERFMIVSRRSYP